MKSAEKAQFDFGANWKAFSERALTSAHVEQAKKDFADLLSGIDLRDRLFLDIGFGQGLSLLIAASLGARSAGCEVNPLCEEVLEQNRVRFFPEISAAAVRLIKGSILEEAVVESLRAHASAQRAGGYDIVHSWGVLHHTGDMERAMRNAATLVAPHGYLVIAVYARHWSSRAWNLIKRFYNVSPAWMQRLLVAIFWPIIYVGKWLVTQRNPLKQSRGMDFYYDIVDWVGGYPYEYATVDELKNLLASFGFRLERCLCAEVPTGCNQFVFKRVKIGAVPGNF